MSAIEPLGIVEQRHRVAKITPEFGRNSNLLGFKMTEADFHKALGEVERRIGDKIELLGSDLNSVKTSVGELGGSIPNFDRVQKKVDHIESLQQDVLLWKAEFEGQKKERDKVAGDSASMWRRIAGGLIVALIVAVIGAGAGMYVQLSNNGSSSHDQP